MAFFSFVTFLVLAIWILGLSSRIAQVEKQLKEGRVPSLASTEKEKEPAPVSAPMAPAVKPPVVPASPPVTPKGDFEIRFGGKLFTIVGGVAVLFGLGFFLRYAFEYNLISPLMRVALGVAAGFVSLGLGEWLRRKYASYGQMLMGLGLGMLYVCAYASLHAYHLASAGAAFVAMVLVTAAGLALAVWLDAEPLAIFAQVGGLLTPLLVGSGQNQPYVLFPYLALLNIAVMSLALLKAWRGITLVGLAGTALVFGSWFMHFYTVGQWPLAQFTASLFFAIFVTAGLARYVVHKAKQDGYDLAVTSATPLLYVFATYAIVPQAFHVAVGAGFAVLGALYLAAAAIINMRDERDRRYRDFLAVIGCALVAVAVPVAFDGLVVVAVWAIAATALTAWSKVLDSRPLRMAAYLVGLLATFTIFVHLGDGGRAMTAWFNNEFLTGMFVVVCAGVSVAVHWWDAGKGEKRLPNMEAEAHAWLSVDLLKMYLLSIFLVWFELTHFYDKRSVILVIPILALLAGWVGCALRVTLLRMAVYATYGVLALLLVMLYGGIPEGGIAVWNLRFCAGLVLLASAGVFQSIVHQTPSLSPEERRGARTSLFIGAHLVGLWLVSTELLSWFDAQLQAAGTAHATAEIRASLYAGKNVGLSVVWTLYALALLVFGIVRRSNRARQFAMALFALTVVKAFLFDTSALSNFYRFISFMTLGILLLVCGYLYNRYRERITRFITEGEA